MLLQVKKSCADTLLGITWTGGANAFLGLESTLVALDPNDGKIQHVYGQVGAENFVGLAYDSTRTRLYALSQEKNLYSIDELSPLNVRLIGKLFFEGSDSINWSANSLCYDPESRSLYCSMRVDYWPYFNGSVLSKINTNTAEVEIIGPFNGVSNNYILSGLAYDEATGQLYGVSNYLSPGSSYPDYTQVVSVNPDDASLTGLYETPAYYIQGLAKGPGDGILYSWMSSDSGHYYLKAMLDEKTTEVLGSSDSAGGVFALTSTAPSLHLKVTGTKVSLSWTPVIGANGYSLYYAPLDVSYTDQIDLGDRTGISFDLWEGAKYYVAILAYDESGVVEISNIEYFTIE